MLTYGVIYGLLLSLVLTVLLVIAGRIALDMFVGDYPPEIKAKYGPMSPRAARIRRYVAPLIVVTTFLVPLIGVFHLSTIMGSVSFLEVFVFSVIALLVFNLYDLLILDIMLPGSLSGDQASDDGDSVTRVTWVVAPSASIHRTKIWVPSGSPRAV